MDTYCPKNQAEWREWLAKNHESCDSIWLIYFKVSSENHNLTWSEAVDQALCFGWIDTTKNTIDSESYKQLFTKRNPQSTWSKINKDKIKKLIKANLMAEAGIKSVEIAKENGNWSILDDVEALIVPDDLKQAFKKHPDSDVFYENLSNSMKKGVLYWIKMAKRESTRQNRITTFVRSAAEGRLPKHFT